MPTENRGLHNALRQVHLKTERFNLDGFAISGLASYLQVPEFDFGVDMGECPISAVSLNHIFLTHAHGDHSRCLMRHHSLRKMMGIPKPSIYYIPENLVENAARWIHAEAIFEGVPEYRFQLPKIVPVFPYVKVPLEYRKDLVMEAFPVKHAIPAMGCTLYLHKNKLKDEFLQCATADIIALRKQKVEITREVFVPLISFMGDTLGTSLLEQRHIWNSEILVTECTFLDEGEEEMANKKGHTHLSQIVQCLNEFGSEIQCKKIILNHFSMKYSEKHIQETLEKNIPEAFRDKIIAFI